ncbi:phage terminase large subunit [Brevibacterium casei]|uniref:phage terminase large subunit n=1 Tax=Brevibacterium casei TaxID=33889 RepID=UPI001E5CA41E|nr:phage terminase large subunit [Brevibacterium casei]
MWVLTQDPDTRITLASYETGVARRWGRAVRDDIRSNQELLGINVRDDISAQQEWELEGHIGGMFTAGIGSALTGRPSNLMIIDDPVKNHEDAISKVKQETAWNWWTETAQSRLHPGTSVVLIMTRWSTGDLGGRILSEPGGEDWEVLSIPAQADHDPTLGETDPLGREPGEFMQTVHGMSDEQWEQRKLATPPKAWSSLYQQRPTQDEGGVFPAEWSRYNQPMWIERDNGTRIIPGLIENGYELAISADLTFRDSETSDYAVIQTWLRVGPNIYLIDMIRRRMNFNDTLDALRSMAAKYPQAAAKYIEARANGDAATTALSRELTGIIPVEPEGTKYTRMLAISPFAHAGNIILPTSSLLPNVEDLIEEARGFPGATHDDTCDGMAIAAQNLLLHPLVSQEQLVADEWADDAPLITQF